MVPPASGSGARALVMETAPSRDNDGVREATCHQGERMSPGSGDLRSGFPNARRLAAATPARAMPAIAVPAAAPHVIAWLNTGYQPDGVAFYPLLDRVYVTNHGSGSV